MEQDAIELANIVWSGLEYGELDGVSCMIRVNVAWRNGGTKPSLAQILSSVDTTQPC